jgi:tRNA(fMet)-specific endonuclease VapC
VERLILDTTVLVAMERDRATLDASFADDDDVAIAAVTAAELRVSVAFASGPRRARRAAFVDEVLSTATIEDYTLATARAHAELLMAVRRSGRPRGAHDLLIAATAVTTARTIVSWDARGFEELPGVPVRLVGAG